MISVRVDAENTIIRLPDRELEWIHQALNEVCHALHGPEIPRTKQDVDSGEALRILDTITEIFDRISNRPPETAPD